ncbi:MAG: heavy-metal-associated domain-containing protein [Bacteroidetes bacterium]|nr:heavy-metal-associated domain-containing protein [Bacteroidota bacterium]
MIRKALHLNLFLMVLLFLNSCDAQIKNTTTVQAKVFGNCEMCQKTIQKAAFVKGEAKAVWSPDTQIAEITFDSTKTNLEAVLKRIAEAGYDNQRFTAPQAAYDNLPSCCQYDRPARQ